MGPPGYLGLIAHRLAAACCAVPRAEDWLLTAALLVTLALVSVPLGLRLGFLQVDICRSWSTAATFLSLTFLFPAVSEELLFRVMLLPHPQEHASQAVQWLWGTVALVVFVASHPLKALVFSSARRSAFTNPVFLLLAGLLGLACTIAYLKSGSLWPPVVIHWWVVVVWLLVFGGQRGLHSTATRNS
jgi:predicted Abi (CAAX) family protease